MTEQLKLLKNSNTYMLDIKSSIALAIKKSKISRAQIAEKMNELIAQDDGEAEITTAQIDSWTKKDEKRTAFVKYLPIFCYVVQDYTPLQEFVSSIGLKVVGARELLLIELGESELRRVEATKNRKKALEGLGEPEDTNESK
jgi:hypothetical protein